MNPVFVRAIAVLASLLAAGPALAHPGHAAGFAGGLAHPLVGPDHLVAMLAIGVWAAQARSLSVPTFFLAGMAAGIGLGLAAGMPGWIEHGLAGSLVALGLILALAVPLRPAIAFSLAAFFGLLHGTAHGAEIAGGAALATVAGMVVASAALHGAGFAAGWVVNGRMAMARLGGAGIAALGAGLLVLG